MVIKSIKYLYKAVKVFTITGERIIYSTAELTLCMNLLYSVTEREKSVFLLPKHWHTQSCTKQLVSSSFSSSSCYTVTCLCCSIRALKKRQSWGSDWKLAAFITTCSDFMWRQWYFNNKAINSYSTHHSPSSYGKTLWIKHQIIGSYTTIFSIVCSMNNGSLEEFLLNTSLAWLWGNSAPTNTHILISRGSLGLRKGLLNSVAPTAQ